VGELKSRLMGSTSLSADPLKADFRNFLYAVWMHLGLPEPTAVQYDIAHFLQHGPKRLIVEAYRGAGKSWITVAYVCWLLYCNPQIKVLVVSASAPEANKFTTFCLQLIHGMPLLHHLRPRPDQRQSMTDFDVGPAQPDKQPSVSSRGITSQITGGRADVIVPDDIEVPHNSDTHGKRELLLEKVKEFDAVLKPLPTSRIAYLGTPQTEQSIYNELTKRGYVARIWPARYPSNPDKYGPKLAPYIVQQMAKGARAGEPTDPQRFSHEDLTERELSYGRSGFALQFMMDTSLSDADKFPLKLTDLIVHPLDPLRAPIDFMWASSPELAYKDDLPIVGLAGDRYYRPMWSSPEAAPYEGCVMAVDPSGRGKDETSYAIVKVLHGRLFLVASGGFQGGYEDATLKALMLIAKKHHVPLIIAEPNYGGGMFTELLRGAAMKYYPVSIEDAEWSTVAKEQRIVDTLEPVMNQHRLIVCPSVIKADFDSTLNREGERSGLYRLFYQMSRMVRQRGALAQDDRLDALAMAVAYWMRQAARDTEKAAIAHHEAKLDAELEKFMEGVLGRDMAGDAAYATAASTTLKRSLKGH
jgi:hypothetical protein